MPPSWEDKITRKTLAPPHLVDHVPAWREKARLHQLVRETPLSPEHSQSLKSRQKRTWREWQTSIVEGTSALRGDSKHANLTNRIQTILQIPPELLELIDSYLDIASRIAFRLSSRFIFTTLRTPEVPWSDIGRADQLKIRQVLDAHVIRQLDARGDLKRMSVLWCSSCEDIHREYLFSSDELKHSPAVRVCRALRLCEHTSLTHAQLQRLVGREDSRFHKADSLDTFEDFFCADDLCKRRHETRISSEDNENLRLVQTVKLITSRIQDVNATLKPLSTAVRTYLASDITCREVRHSSNIEHVIARLQELHSKASLLGTSQVSPHWTWSASLTQCKMACCPSLVTLHATLDKGSGSFVFSIQNERWLAIPRSTNTWGWLDVLGISWSEREGQRSGALDRSMRQKKFANAKSLTSWVWNHFPINSQKT